MKGTPIMTPKLTTLLLGVAALALTAGLARAETNSTRKPRRESIALKKGPATIDVSKYPDGIKDNYEVFSTKCTQCHKLSRPINLRLRTPDEWSRYIKRMMHKPGSGISSADGKKIYRVPRL